MYIPSLKARIFTISSSPSSFHSTRPLSVETLWVAMVMVSITKSQSVKSICHATKPDGEPGSRARYTWSKMDQISHHPDCCTEQLLTLVLKLWWHNKAIIFYSHQLSPWESITITNTLSVIFFDEYEIRNIEQLAQIRFWSRVVFCVIVIT